MKKIIFIIAVAPVIANAGLFGPSNFEECILKGMKNVSSDQAANMIAYACREKFPAPKSTTPDAPLYESPKSFYFRSTDDLGSTVTQLIVKIETNHMRVRTHGTDYGSGIRSHDFGYHLEIEARNRNDFRIGGIWVGVPKKKGVCSWSEESYSEIYNCSGIAQAGASGTFRCDIPRVEKRQFNTCTIGFDFHGTNSELNAFRRKNGIP